MKFIFAGLFAFFLSSASAGWWIFGGSDETEGPRLSELMEPASLLIDEASDLAGEGKVTESVQKYREALQALDRVAEEHVELLDKPEFSTIKTKRAFVSAAIDSMLLSQARQNAKVVSTSDTTELEKKLAAERGETVKITPRKDEVKPPPKVAPTAPQFGSSPRDRAMKAIYERNFTVADALIAEILEKNPKSVLGLNLRATKEAVQGQFKKAEATLDELIESNPRDYHAYYNMAQLYLQTRGEDGKKAAQRYYETGRLFGGPQNLEMEDSFK